MAPIQLPLLVIGWLIDYVRCLVRVDGYFELHQVVHSVRRDNEETQFLRMHKMFAEMLFKMIGMSNQSGNQKKGESGHHQRAGDLMHTQRVH